MENKVESDFPKRLYFHRYVNILIKERFYTIDDFIKLLNESIENVLNNLKQTHSSIKFELFSLSYNDIEFCLNFSRDETEEEYKVRLQQEEAKRLKEEQLKKESAYKATKKEVGDYQLYLQLKEKYEGKK